MPQQASTSRLRVPTVKRVAHRNGYKVVRHEGADYALVPMQEIERLEDEEDSRDVARALDRIQRGLEKPVPYEQVRRKLGLE
jgi:hypothetical protein